MTELGARFEITDEGDIDEYLGVKVQVKLIIVNNNTVRVCQICEWMSKGENIRTNFLLPSTTLDSLLKQP